MSSMCLHVFLQRAVSVLGVCECVGGEGVCVCVVGVRLMQGLMSSKCQTNSDMLELWAKRSQLHFGLQKMRSKC